MTITPPFGRMFNFHEAALFLGMPEQRLRRLVAAKKIPVVRDGRLAFLEHDLVEWVTRHRTPAADEPKSQHITLPPVSLEPAGIEDLMPKRRRLQAVG